MNPTLRRPLLILAAGSLGTVTAALSPLLLRHFDAFRVRGVEVVGAQFLPPQEVLAFSGITDSASVFDDLDPFRTRLLGHRLIADARLQKRLPGTLRIVVTETEPVALVRGSELRAVDANGRLLPVQTAGADLDVPILLGTADVEGEDSVLAAPVRDLVLVLGRIRTLDPDLAADISEVGPAAGGGVRLIMTWPGQPEILVLSSLDSRTFRQIHEVLDHLDAEPAPGTVVAPAVSPGRLARIDARYVDELFVSFHSR